VCVGALVGALQQRNASSQQQQAAAVANESGVLAKRKIKEIVDQVSPGERIDPEVEEVLLEIAEDFVDNVTNWACQLAKHRKSQTLEVRTNTHRNCAPTKTPETHRINTRFKQETCGHAIRTTYLSLLPPHLFHPCIL